MNLNKIILVLLILLLFSCYKEKVIAVSYSYPTMKSQTKFITELKGIKEYSLQNGIKVLLKENHSIPLVTFSVSYKVGSRNEQDGGRGLAHFLEHMMFKGTKKYKKGEISEIIQSHGGVFNAYTSDDGTCYFETISPKYLEKVVDIESDRMKNSQLNEDELTLEKTVVLSELEGGLNNPATLLYRELRNNAYDKSPYKHPVIGYEEDIKKTNSNIMRNFYNKYYNPNNATIILVGDFNEKNALSLIERYFGNIKNNSEVEVNGNILRDSKQTKEKRFNVKRASTFKLLVVAYHITDAVHEDLYPLNIIEEILIKGKKSPLNKALIEKGLATEVSGGAEANKDPGLFYILVSLTPKAKHKNVEEIILNEIEKLTKNPPTEKEIIAAKNRSKVSYLLSLDGTQNFVNNLGFFEFINSWKQAVEWPDLISRVTEEDVETVLKKYFTKENRTIGYFIPKIKKGEKYEVQPLSLSKTQHYNNKTQTIERNNLSQITNQFKYKKQTLSDGSTLLIYKDIDLPITYISGVIKGGTSILPKEKEWECEIIARTLEKGSKNYTKEEIEDILDNTGSHVDFSCDEESFKFNIATLNDNLFETIRLFLDILTNPVFQKDEIKLEINKLIAEIIEAKDDTNETARRKITQLIYPKDHPYYTNDFDADIKLIKKIKAKDLLDTHEKLIKSKTELISLVSNLSQDELTKFIYELESGLSTNKTREDIDVNIPDTLPREDPKTEISILKDKLQSDVVLGHAGFIKRNDPDFYRVHLANYILGGSPLTSRLAKKVRDNTGLVYTIYSYVSASYGKGEFGIYFGSNNDNVNKAIELVKEEIKEFTKNGVTKDELDKAKSALVDSFIARNLSTYKNISNTLLGIEFYNLGENYINDYPKIINSISKEEINNITKKYFLPNKLNISIAGDYKDQRSE